MTVALVGLWCCQAVLFPFLSFFFCCCCLLIFSSDFTLHDTCHHGAAHQRALCGTSRPLLLTLCLSLWTDGIWDGWLQNVPWWGTLVGRVAEPLPTLATREVTQCSLWVGPSQVCLLPIWEKKENSVVPKYLQGNFQISFVKTFFFFPTVFFVPLPRISVPLAVILWISFDADSLSCLRAVVALRWSGSSSPWQGRDTHIKIWGAGARPEEGEAKCSLPSLMTHCSLHWQHQGLWREHICHELLAARWEKSSPVTWSGVTSTELPSSMNIWCSNNRNAPRLSNRHPVFKAVGSLPWQTEKALPNHHLPMAYHASLTSNPWSPDYSPHNPSPPGIWLPQTFTERSGDTACLEKDLLGPIVCLLAAVPLQQCGSLSLGVVLEFPLDSLASFPPGWGNTRLSLKCLTGPNQLTPAREWTK